MIYFTKNSENDTEGVLKIGPGVIPFFEKVWKYYELIVFITDARDYESLLIDVAEENKCILNRDYIENILLL